MGTCAGMRTSVTGWSQGLVRRWWMWMWRRSRRREKTGSPAGKETPAKRRQLPSKRLKTFSSVSDLTFHIKFLLLKALFNNVFTLKNLSYMSLHAISVFDKCKHEGLKKLQLKSTIKCFKKVKICKWPEIPYTFLPIDCCVRINGLPDCLFSGDIQS